MWTEYALLSKYAAATPLLCWTHSTLSCTSLLWLSLELVVADGPASIPRTVTYKVKDDVCDKHPTWKQCKKKAIGAAGGVDGRGGNSKAELVTLSSGLKVQDLVAGKGNTPRSGDSCTVHYSLYYNGDEIESSRESSGLAASPIGFQFGVSSGVGSVIPAIALGYTHIHTDTHTHTHIHVHTHTRARTHIHTCTKIYTHARRHTHKTHSVADMKVCDVRMHTHIHTHLHTCTRTYAHIYTHIHRYAHVHRYIHTHTHTHTHTVLRT